MTTKVEKLKNVTDFESLVQYLIEELSWPIEDENINEITFNYEPKTLGISDDQSVKINSIKQIRPLSDTQPWGLFYIDFEPKKLPVVILRRILKALEVKKRPTADRLKTWNMEDLIFISALGEEDSRKMTFAKFVKKEQGLEELRTFSWDRYDTELHFRQSTFDLDKLTWPPDENDIEGWRSQWSKAFPRPHRYTITTSQQLSQEMAKLASNIRQQVKEVYAIERRDGPLHKLFDNFKQVLIHDLNIDSFSDMYAQTITYGLFSAKATHEEKFAEDDIVSIIPNTNPFLKDLFRECTKIGEDNELGLDLDELGVTELIDTLKETDIESVLSDFGRQQRREDPVIHFYEEFLKQYDAAQKVERGVFYTPDPVVSFIVRSVDEILKKEFGLKDGLADTTTIKVQRTVPKKTGGGTKTVNDEVPKVQILDPAVGTGTFLKHTIENIKKTFDEKNKHLSKTEKQDKWNKYVEKDLLPRLFGFELLLAPYAVAHLKIELTLAETGYDFKSSRRLGIYLTNTLEGKHIGSGTLDAYYNWLANEGKYANVIKANNAISIVIGNPPYSGESANKTQWSYELMRGKASDDSSKWNYFSIEGKDLGERNPKWLNDDYVKFIRFGQWRIDKTGIGVLAFITPHGYIDNPTFRGMREKLLLDFDEIFILDLHGNANKKEICLDGNKDENVFDIRQGVSISFFIKNNTKKSQYARVKKADLFGLRNFKYQNLFKNNIETINWHEIYPQSEDFLFIEQDTKLKEEYEKGMKIIDLMNTYSAGIATARDHFTIQQSEDDIWNLLIDFISLSVEQAREKYNLRKDVRDWKVKFAQDDIRNSGPNKSHIHPILYRPFDLRYTYYTGNTRGFHCMPRREVMDNMINENIAFIVSRSSKPDPWRDILITNHIVEFGIIATRPGNAAPVSPLYLYKGDKKYYNFNEKSYNKLVVSVDYYISQEDLFYYIIGLLHSNNYRIRYEEYLKQDYPRIILPKKQNLFQIISTIGRDISTEFINFDSNHKSEFIQLIGSGDNRIEFYGEKYYNSASMKIKINKNQYLNNIDQEVYDFYIGSYRVVEKWLKSHKGQILNNKLLKQFNGMVVSIKNIIKNTSIIDDAIEEHGGWPLR